MKMLITGFLISASTLSYCATETLLTCSKDFWTKKDALLKVEVVLNENRSLKKIEVSDALARINVSIPYVSEIRKRSFNTQFIHGFYFDSAIVPPEILNFKPSSARPHLEMRIGYPDSNHDTYSFSGIDYKSSSGDFTYSHCNVNHDLLKEIIGKSSATLINNTLTLNERD